MITLFEKFLFTGDYLPINETKKEGEKILLDFLKNQKVISFIEDKDKKIEKDEKGNLKYNILINDEFIKIKAEFDKICQKLNNKPNYIPVFIKFYTEGVDINRLFEMFDYLNANKYILDILPKNIVEYENFEDLEDDITTAKHDYKFNKIIKDLYPEMREPLIAAANKNHDIKNIIVDFADKLDKDKKKVAELNKTENITDPEKMHKVSFPPLKYFINLPINNNDMIREFIGMVKDYLQNDLGGEKDKVMAIVKKFGNKVKVVYDDHNVLVLNTEDRLAVKALGSQKWCIVYSDSHFENYCGAKTMNTQYIIYNFNVIPSSNYSLFGITIDKEGNEPSSGERQNKANISVPYDEILKLLELPEGILVPKPEFKKLGDFLKAVKNNDIKTIKKMIMSIDRTFPQYSEAISTSIENKNEEIFNLLMSVNLNFSENEFAESLNSDFKKGIDYGFKNNIPLNANTDRTSNLISKVYEFDYNTIYKYLSSTKNLEIIDGVINSNYSDLEKLNILKLKYNENNIINAKAEIELFFLKMIRTPEQIAFDEANYYVLFTLKNNKLDRIIVEDRYSMDYKNMSIVLTQISDKCYVSTIPNSYVLKVLKDNKLELKDLETTDFREILAAKINSDPKALNNLIKTKKEVKIKEKKKEE